MLQFCKINSATNKWHTCVSNFLFWEIFERYFRIMYRTLQSSSRTVQGCYFWVNFGQWGLIIIEPKRGDLIHHSQGMSWVLRESISSPHSSWNFHYNLCQILSVKLYTLVVRRLHCPKNLAILPIPSGPLSRMIGKPWLRVKWGGSLLKDLESCKGSLQLSCKNLGKCQKF